MKNRIRIIIIASIIIVSFIAAGISQFRPSFISDSNQNADKKLLETNNEEDTLLESEENVDLDNEETFAVEYDNEGSDELLRIDMQGAVAVAITFLNPTELDQDYLNFEVQLNTHSVNLDIYDLSEMTIVNVGEDTKINSDLEWRVLEGEGHHITGLLRVPMGNNQNESFYETASFIELEIQALDEIKSRKFRWERKKDDNTWI